jgi:hypothetical protein
VESPASAAVAPEQQQQQQHLLSNSLNYVWGSSLSLYGSLRDKAYDRSTIINYGFDKLEEIAKKSQPYAQKLYSSVEPVVGALDTKVDRIVDTVKSKGSSVKTTIIPDAWMERVDATLAPRFDVRQSFDYFVSTATVAYVQLSDAASSAANSAASAASSAASAASSAATTTREKVAATVPAAVTVNYDEFLTVVKAQLAKVWDLRLAAAAKGTFTLIQTKITDVSASIPRTADGAIDVAELTVALRQQLAAAYEASVVEVFRAHVASPAAAVYNVAVEQFERLKGSVAVGAGKTAAAANAAADAASGAVDDAAAKVAAAASGDNAVAAPAAAPASPASVIPVPSFAEFFESVKARLGVSYTAALEQPLRDFYASAVDATVARKQQLQQVVSVLRFDEAGHLTLHDVYFSSVSALHRAKTYLNDCVAGTYSAIVTTTAAVVDKIIPADAAAASASAAAAAPATVAAGPEPPVEGVASPVPAASITESSSCAADASAAPATLTAVGSLASARVARRLHEQLSVLKAASSQRLASLRDFSSTRIRALTGIDVVDRAAEATRQLEAALVAGQAKLVAGQASVASAASPVTAKVSEVVGSVQAQAGSVHAQASSHLASGVAALQASLDGVRSALAGLAAASADSAPAQSVQARVKALEPSLVELRARLELAMQRARDVAAASGSYALHTQFNAIGGDARQLASALASRTAPAEDSSVAAGAANVAALLSAVRGVFFWSDDAGAASAAFESEAEAEAEAVAEAEPALDSEAEVKPVAAALAAAPAVAEAAAPADADADVEAEAEVPLAAEDAAVIAAISQELDAVAQLPSVAEAAGQKGGKKNKNKK